MGTMPCMLSRESIHRVNIFRNSISYSYRIFQYAFSIFIITVESQQYLIGIELSTCNTMEPSVMQCNGAEWPYFSSRVTYASKCVTAHHHAHRHSSLSSSSSSSSSTLASRVIHARQWHDGAASAQRIRTNDRIGKARRACRMHAPQRRHSSTSASASTTASIPISFRHHSSARATQRTDVDDEERDTVSPAATKTTVAASTKSTTDYCINHHPTLQLIIIYYKKNQDNKQHTQITTKANKQTVFTSNIYITQHGIHAHGVHGDM